MIMYDPFKIIESVEELKEQRPDLVEFYGSLTHEQLLDQIFLEVLDGVNMETRVSLFMSECTNNMSKTNYTMETLRTLIEEQKNIDAQIAVEDWKYGLPL